MLLIVSFIVLTDNACFFKNFTNPQRIIAAGLLPGCEQFSLGGVL